MVQIQYNYGVMMEKAILKFHKFVRSSVGILKPLCLGVITQGEERVENVDFVEF